MAEDPGSSPGTSTTESERRAYYRERYHRTRREAIAHLGGKCVDCGTAENLQFDHADASSKEFDVSQLLNGQRKERLYAELAKCVLRCAPCHAKKSTKNGDNGAVPHGGGISGKRNCKCDLCRAQKSKYMQAWKAARHGGDS